MPSQVSFRFRWLDLIRRSGFHQSDWLMGKTIY